MHKIIAELSNRAEFILVVAVAFGWITAGSLAAAFHLAPAAHHGNGSLIALAIVEIAIMVVLAAFLAARGWTFAKIGLRPTAKDTGIGLLLWLAAYALWIVVWMLTAILSPQTAQTISHTQVVVGAVSLSTAVTVSLVNPLFEEVFVVGYVMTALRSGKSEWMTVNVSVALRLLYHLYQGPLGVLSIIPIGIIFAFWYLRTGRLWPVIVAHAAMDLIALLAST